MTTEEIQTAISKVQQQRAKKISELNRRQRKREATGLYHHDAKEHEDYIVCPIANVRFTKIKSNHIEGTLDMTQEDYYSMFPHLKGVVADRLKKNISNGQKTKMAFDEHGKPVLNEAGKHLTTNEVGQIKARETQTAIDPITGKSIDQMSGAKTRDTHLSKIDEYGLHGYHRIGKRAIHKGNATKSSKYGYRSATQISDFDRYSNIIDYFTYKGDTNLYTNGQAIKTRRDGGANCQQIDHMYSVRDGMNNKISPICVAMPENTEIMPARLNESKNDNSSISKNELFTLTNYTEQQSDTEFALFEMLIDKYKKASQYNSALQFLTDMLDELNALNNPMFDGSIKFIRYMINKSNY